MIVIYKKASELNFLAKEMTEYVENYREILTLKINFIGKCG